jgi:hypothetical protein
MSKKSRSIKSETTIEKAMFNISLNFPVAPMLAAANSNAKIAV